MAKTSSNKTIWTLGLVAVMIFLALKLWPALKRKLSGGSGSSGGTVGGASGYGDYPYQNPQTSGQPKLGLNFGGGSGSGGSSGSGGAGSVLRNFLSMVNGESAQNSATLSQVDVSPTSSLFNSITGDNSDFEPQENLTDLPSWSQDDPNAPWNSDSSSGSIDDGSGDSTDFEDDGFYGG